MRRRHVIMLIAALALGSAVLAGCGDDEGSGDPADTSATTLRDQDRDRDRLQDTVDDIVAACQDQDRDRLRDHTQDQDRDRLRDGTCDAIPDGADVTVTSTEVSVEGDEATVEVQLQVRTRDGNTYELGDTWRFRWAEEDGWVLSEIPATIDSTQTSPTTLQAQDRDQERDQDCETPSTLEDQERDQDCDRAS